MDHNRANGVCKVGLNCPKAIQDYRQRGITPTLCGWQGFTQVICCETNGATPNAASATTKPTTKPTAPTGTTKKPTKDPATLTKSERSKLMRFVSYLLLELLLCNFTRTWTTYSPILPKIPVRNPNDNIKVNVYIDRIRLDRL